MYIKGSQANFSKYIAFLSLNIVLVLASNADQDEMPHNEAFRLVLNCLPKSPFSLLSTGSTQEGPSRHN